MDGGSPEAILNTIMPIIVGTLIKDPEETRLYKMDWSAHLDLHTITASSWTIPDGLTLVANGIVEGNTKTYMIVSGGTAETSYVVTNTITISTTNEVYQRSGQLDVRQY